MSTNDQNQESMNFSINLSDLNSVIVKYMAMAAMIMPADVFVESLKLATEKMFSFSREPEEYDRYASITNCKRCGSRHTTVDGDPIEYWCFDCEARQKLRVRRFESDLTDPDPVVHFGRIARRMERRHRRRYAFVRSIWRMYMMK